MIVIMVSYLVTGLEIDNAIIGCIIYVVLALINIKIFLSNEMNWLFKETEKYVKKILKIS